VPRARCQAAIVSVGNELLFGQTVDTNAAWLSRALADRGISVLRRFTVRDVEVDIQEAVSAAARGVDLVIVSGGLGPTPDDITTASVARGLGLSLTADRQGVEVPQYAQLLTNPVGTAPGVLIESGQTTIVLLPGVPRELEAVFEGDLEAALADLAGPDAGSVHHRVVHTTGIAEPMLADAVQERLYRGANEYAAGITLAYLPSLRGVDLRFSITDARGGKVEERFDRLIEELNPALVPWRFEAEHGDLAEAVATALERSGRTLAVVESCTGGLLAKRMTDGAGASKVFVGGVIAYANKVKVAQVGVTDEMLEQHGGVSEVVAKQLARGAAKRLGAEVGIGITGVAGPGGGAGDKPVGTVWIAVSVDGVVESIRTHFKGDRGSVRERAVQAALASLYRRLMFERTED
jgi:nicotinamide-nucleotide amidase